MFDTAGLGGAWVAGNDAAVTGFASTGCTAAALVRRVRKVRLSEEIMGERRIDVIN
jgi:hypothetical protein